MNTLLASYTATSGAVVELHYAGKFWTARKDEYGTTLVHVPDPWQALEHYDLAKAEGRVVSTFPMKLRGAA